MPAEPKQATHEPLAEALERWDFELGVARAFLPEDPINCLSWTQRIDDEIVAELDTHPDLGPLHEEARTLIEQSRAASQRFLAESTRREHDFEAREHEQLSTPMARIRQPH